MVSGFEHVLALTREAALTARAQASSAP